MKNFLKITLVLLVVFTSVQCSSDDDNSQNTTPEEGTIIGRWKLADLSTVEYEFTTNKRFAIYQQNDGTFPTLEEFQLENPDLTGLDWEYDGDTVVVDLNFGNFSRLIPTFKCENKVIDWMDENNELHSTYYRVDHDITTCN
ncbi:hypothetical protein [Lacinutrix salivirga]